MAPASSKRTTILLSLTIAVVLVVGAYFLAGHRLSGTSIASAESSEEALKAYAAKDSDGDGLPDWEESLYGTDPKNAHSVRPDMTDAEAVAKGLVTPRYANAAATSTTTTDLAAGVPGGAAAPGSLTDQFAQLFFSSYMSTRGDTVPSSADMQAFVQHAVAQLESTEVRPDEFSASDMKISGSGSAALTAYASGADAAFAAHTLSLPYDPLAYFSDAVNKNDATALTNLDQIASTYTALAKALAAVPAPSEAAQAQLHLVNAFAKIGGTVGDLAVVNQDPVRSMLGLGNYGSDMQSLVAALGEMRAVFAADGASVDTTGGGHYLYELLNSSAPGEAATP